ncbi:MAG: phospholipase D family protein [Pseudomonadales bacterium]|nr:phospholipase D family protein [Pseudomonadales bacterium]
MPDSSRSMNMPLIGSLPLLYILLCPFLTTGCASTNFDVERTTSHALPISHTTTLGRDTLEWQETRQQNISAFFPLSNGSDALGARLKLIDAAEHSIDMQYFLMKDDTVGALFSAKLLEAAERGVRIRFLLDDIFTTVEDADLHLLNQHDNIEVRLFNPISRRGFKKINYLGDFNQANRRMHNKSFTVDGCFSIVGGRNLAAEYFNLKANNKFFDLDILAKGPIAKEVADNFDDYWNYTRALPIEYTSKIPDDKTLKARQQRLNTIMQSRGAEAYQAAIDSPLLQQLINAQIKDFEAEARVISERPEKLDLSTGDDSIRLVHDLGQIMLQAKQEVVIFTPYFIPTASGMDFLASVMDNGVQLKVLTNSLASTNHVPVHSAYDSYRKDLLTMGIELYEARPDAFAIFDSTADKSTAHISTLHTKLIVIDKRLVFIGSLNMDPRSVIINTEMGILIDSPPLAAALLTDKQQQFEQMVYRLSLNEKNNIQWQSQEGNQLTIETKDPQTSWWRRFTSGFYKILPEGQL